MRKIRLITALLSLGIGAALLGGCSSSTGTKEKTTGSLSDPQFQAAQTVMASAGEFDGMLLDVAFQAVDSVFQDSANPTPIHVVGLSLAAEAGPDSVSLTYHTNTEYWYFYGVTYDSAYDTTAIDTQLIVTRFLIQDSVQFLHGSNIVQWPDSALLTEIRNGVHVSVTNSSSTDSVYVHQRVTIGGDIPNRGDVVINGSRGFEINFSTFTDTDTCQFALNMGATAGAVGLNVVDVDQNDGCPTSGRMTYSGNIGVACVTPDTSLTYNDGWIITQSFNGDIINYVFENSTTRWTFSDTCQTQVTASPYKRIASMIANGL